MVQTKVCKKCKRELPATLEFYHRKDDCKLGLRPQCKECRGTSFGIHAPNRVMKAKEGHKICTGCKNELPVTDEYFVKQARSKDGYISKCKQCKGTSYGVHQPNKAISTPEGHKICSVCREIKQITEFPVMRANKDGHASRCKPCDYEVHKKMYNKNPETLAKKKTYAKNYRIQYYKTEKGKMVNIINCQRRKARKQNAIYNYSQQDWDETLAFFNSECAYCGVTGKELEQEHVIPLSDTGHYTRQNIIPACGRCNGSKHNYKMEEWYSKQPFFSAKRLNKIYKWTKYSKDSEEIQLSFL